MRLEALLLTAIGVACATAQPRPGQTEVQTFHFAHLTDQFSYKEIVTTLEQVARVSPNLPVDSASGALTVSGTKDELEAAAWIVEKLNTSGADSPDAGSHKDVVSEKPFTGADGNVFDIFYLPSEARPVDVQEMITTLRQVAEINHLFNYSARKAIIFEAAPNDAKLAEWLIRTASNPASPTPAEEDFHVPGKADDVTRVLHWNASLTSEDVHQMITAIRRQAEISKIFRCGATRAIAMRGTAAQLAIATDLVTNYQPAH